MKVFPSYCWSEIIKINRCCNNFYWGRKGKKRGEGCWLLLFLFFFFLSLVRSVCWGTGDFWLGVSVGDCRKSIGSTRGVILTESGRALPKLKSVVKPIQKGSEQEFDFDPAREKEGKKEERTKEKLTWSKLFKEPTQFINFLHTSLVGAYPLSKHIPFLSNKVTERRGGGTTISVLLIPAYLQKKTVPEIFLLSEKKELIDPHYLISFLWFSKKILSSRIFLSSSSSSSE